MMPWKLVLSIAVLSIALIFIGFNTDNRCDISLVFVKLKAVPVVITMLSFYLLGLLTALLLTVRKKVARQGRPGRSDKKNLPNRSSGTARKDSD